MPDLPAISLSTAQFNRVKAVIPGGTNAEKAAAYQTMVKDMLRRLVLDADMRAAQEAAQATVDAAAAASAANPDNP